MAGKMKLQYIIYYDVIIHLLILFIFAFSRKSYSANWL